MRAAATRPWSNPPLLCCLALLIYAVAIGNAVRKLGQPNSTLGDFATFRDGAIALSRGQDIYSSGQSQYVYPPLIAFLYQPFSRLSMQTAGAADLVVNSLLALLTLALASAEMSRRFLGRSSLLSIARIAVVAALLTSDKIRAEFNM